MSRCGVTLSEGDALDPRRNGSLHGSGMWGSVSAAFSLGVFRKSCVESGRAREKNTEAQRHEGRPCPVSMTSSVPTLTTPPTTWRMYSSAAQLLESGSSLFSYWPNSDWPGFD